MTPANFALLWDMDGTLIDTKDSHISSFKEVFENYHFPFDETVCNANFGRTTRSILPLMLGYEPDPELMDALLDEKERIFLERAPEEARLVSGAETWLATARAMHIPQAIASSGYMENIETMISSFHLTAYFDAFVSGAELPAKPEPDVFLEAADVLGLPPERCLVIEDSLAGVGAAKNAGMMCVAVSTSCTPEALVAADIVVSDFTIPLEGVLQALGLF